jgi:hypothetical protein
VLLSSGRDLSFVADEKIKGLFELWLLSSTAAFLYLAHHVWKKLPIL